VATDRTAVTRQLVNAREVSQMSGFQLSGDAPTAYTRFALKIVEPWTDDLILAAGCRDGDRVLDVACGTGVIASRVNLVSRKLCYVTGIDINEGMLNVARGNSQVEWHQGSATDLPFDAGSFDVVLCQQGLQYFPDRPVAMKEMARVLAPGGRIALNVWGALERQPFFVEAIAAIGMFLGADAQTPFYRAFSLNSADELRQLANDAGLHNSRVRFEHRTMRYPVLERFVVGWVSGAPITAQFLALPDDRKQAFIAHFVERLASFVDDAGLAVPMENHFLTASK
jgi:ubiquinone/menaquinone biosynthesis C-methylase UbiE